VIETARLRLRPFREDDVDEILRWVSDPSFTRYLGGGWDRATVTAMVERAALHRAAYGFSALAVDDRATGELVGRSGLAFHSSWDAAPEVGWWIAPERQGSGLATEAGAACVAHAFDDLGLGHVVSIALEGNLASRRVMAKLGFRLHERVPSEWGELWVHTLDRDSVNARRAR
jgi:RimJ/RimL family protein N-acetyltransferase